MTKDFPSVYGKWYAKARECMESGSYKEALGYYDKAIEERKNWALPISGKGYALFQLGRFDEAIVCFSEANKISPNHEETLNNLAGALILAKRYEESLKISDKAILLNTHNFLPWLNKGIAYREAGNPEESIKNLLEARKLDPKQPTVLYNLVNSYNEMRNYGEALKFCDEALKLVPNSQIMQYYKKKLPKRIARLNKNKQNIEIKKQLLDISRKYSRINIYEIMKKTKISNKRLIFEVIDEMFLKKEIDVSFDSSSQYYTFKGGNKTRAIDAFIPSYNEEDSKKLKKK